MALGSEGIPSPVMGIRGFILKVLKKFDRVPSYESPRILLGITIF